MVSDSSGVGLRLFLPLPTRLLLEGGGPVNGIPEQTPRLFTSTDPTMPCSSSSHGVERYNGDDLKVYLNSSHVTKHSRGNIITYSLTQEILTWLEQHTGPMILGEFPDRFVNTKIGWRWGGAIYGDRGGFIEFAPERANVAMLFKLTWGGQ